MKNKVRKLVGVSAIMTLCASTGMTASASNLTSSFDRSLILMEPSSVLTGALVAGTVGATLLIIVGIIKALVHKFRGKPFGYVSEYITFTSTLIPFSNIKTIYPFWAGTKRMKVTKTLFDLAVLGSLMALCRAATVAVITTGFTLSPKFFELVVSEFYFETSGENLSSLIVGTFTVIAIIRTIEYFKYKKSAL